MQRSMSRRTFVRSLGAGLGGVALANRAWPAGLADLSNFSPQGAASGVSDWPEWRGRGRLGVWNESGIVERFPERGLDVLWRTPVRGGYAGPAVAGGRLFLTDFQQSRGLRGTERAFCLDEKTGAMIWSRDWEVNYQGLLD